MNRPANARILPFLLVCFLFISANSVYSKDYSEYGMGGIADTPLPEWIKPSPLMNVQINADELDESCDNSASLPPVGNQSQQNSCSGWGTGYYYMTYLQGQEFGWDLTLPEHIMSPAFVYNLINGGEDAGATPYDGFEVFELMGCGTMADMPYNVSNYLNLPTETCFRNAMNFRIDETFSLNIFNQAGRDALKQHLLDGNIAVIHIHVYQNFMDIEDFDNNYCVSDIYGTRLGGHVVTVVGFDDEYETVDGTGAFKMVNSWGSNWGDAGFWWLSYQAAGSSTANSGFAIYANDRIGYEPTMTARIEIEHGDRYKLIHSVGIGNALDPDEFINFWDWGYDRDSNIPFDDDAVLLFDISDLSEFIDPDDSNELFYSATDYRANSSIGTIEDVRIFDLEEDFCALSFDTPVMIPDYTLPGWADVVLRYDAVPPADFTAELDVATGEVSLEWTAIEETPGFLSYVIFRDGTEIATSTDPEYVDTLPGFGQFSYSVASRFIDTDSPQCSPADVIWIEPVIPRFLGINSVVGETGEFVFGWEELRDQALLLDDGTAENAFLPSGTTGPGAMISRRLTADEDGQIVGISAYFCEGENMENPQIRLLLQDDNNNLPGAVFYESEIFNPEAESWVDAVLQLERLHVDTGENIWVTVKWESVTGAYLGRDMDSINNEGWAISIDGEEWTYMTNGGNPMIRAELGVPEIVGGPEGLTGFDVYMDDELIAACNDQSWLISGTFPAPGEYEFRVDADYQQGVFASDPYSFEWDGGDVSVEPISTLPEEWIIGSPYPNPFNPVTTISIQLPASAHVKSVVYNMLGQEVSVLANENFRQGKHSLIFDGKSMSSGVYFLQTSIANHKYQVNKILLMK